MFLTADEIVALTGYQRPSDQRRWLASHGWRHEADRLGRPVVLRSLAERMLGGEAIRKSAEPDFTAIRKAA